MPVAPTYPGVYIEEIPSGVRTLTGVATSITAFVGYTPRGKVNEPIRVLNFGDFEREFGGLAFDSPVSYCVKHFFQNGGGEALVVRVAAGAAPARVQIESATGVPVLELTAASEGTWGNNLRVDVDYNTSNPANLFNVAITEVVVQNSQLKVEREEMFRNLTMADTSPNYAIDVINDSSRLVVAHDLLPPSGFGRGSSSSPAFLPTESIVITAQACNPLVALDGDPPVQISLTARHDPANTNILAAVTTEIVTAVNNAIGAGSVQAGTVTDRIVVERVLNSRASSVQISPALERDASSALRLSLTHQGTEFDGAAAFRPRQTGTIAANPVIQNGTNGALTIEVREVSTLLETIALPLWATAPATLADVVTDINTALALVASTNPRLVGATAQLFGGMIRIRPGLVNANISFAITAAGLTPTPMAQGLAGYALGSPNSLLGQVGGFPGSNGTAPTVGDFTVGNEVNKRAIYALEKADLFNLLVIPEACSGAMNAVLIDAISYCTRRRAMLLIDAPPNLATPADALAWISGTAAPLRSRNSAIFFPRISAPDPMMNNRLRAFPAAGAIAGLCARTDAERGVWKAPAGTSATIVGATGLRVPLTDREQGLLNPLALNCLRTFPVVGTVSWGARTGRGADLQADEYKYIPVRRLALFIEESLYRGTQWVVFEPNDEPLWAQIRLNLGAFMHNLFAQGAFQGSTPRQAYFVKCDKETTTQNDIDLGRVNIRVGFAPLKPAEFVVIQIQQIAGAIAA